jgi:dipeptidyl aminopeptidase/acylaminoacyl peptidase
LSLVPGAHLGPYRIAALIGVGGMASESFAVAEGINIGPRTPFSVSTNGSLAYLIDILAPDSLPAWFDRTGKQLAAISLRGKYERIQLSPDDRRVAFDRELDVFLFDIDRGLTTRFVSNPAADFAPVWSPTGRSIAFASSREPAGNVGPRNVRGGNLYERAVGVVGADALRLKTDAGKTPTDWSRDGRYVAYTSRGDVWALPLSDAGKSQPLRVTNTPFAESDARFSSDGRWNAHQSNESGTRTDVYVQSFPGPGAKQQIYRPAADPSHAGRGTEESFSTSLPTSP